MPAEPFNQYLHDAFTTMCNVTESGGAIYVCHADSEGSNFRVAVFLVWDEQLVSYKDSV
jgi:hypothetical protein